MTELSKPRYVIETKEIQVTERPDGGTTTRLADLSFRVKDSFTGMPIGVVIHTAKGEYEARYIFAGKGNQNLLNPPSGGWGPRFDLAADALWKQYSESLPGAERVKRWMWRWMGVTWFLFGTVWGVFMSLLGRALGG